MALFTFFLDYRGGTYISQVRAKDYRAAPRVWVTKLELDKIPNVQESFREDLRKSIDFEEPVPIDGLRNTWCCALTYVKGSMLHFTQTERTGSD